ncbi:MAG: hypothetical protein RSE22_07140, partial [Mucinivorans sp.]
PLWSCPKSIALVGLAGNFVLAGGVEMQHFKGGHASGAKHFDTAGKCKSSLALQRVISSGEGFSLVLFLFGRKKK